MFFPSYLRLPLRQWPLCIEIILKIGNTQFDCGAWRYLGYHDRPLTSIGNSVRFNWSQVTGESRKFIHTIVT